MSKKNNENDLTNSFGELFKQSIMRQLGIDQEELNELAVGLKSFYDSFIYAGFTEEQAMTIVLGIVTLGDRSDE